MSKEVKEAVKILENHIDYIMESDCAPYEFDLGDIQQLEKVIQCLKKLNEENKLFYLKIYGEYK